MTLPFLLKMLQIKSGPRSEATFGHLVKPEMKLETKIVNHEDKGDSYNTKKNSNRTILKPEMAYFQVRSRTCSKFLISNPARFLLHSSFFLIQLLQIFFYVTS